ncbi:MAG: lipoprotein-releasing ABC transporter permease subunit [Alphaproteobacteria bacterium]
MISPFVRTVAFRYLRARRQEGFVSVIAGFSLLGIALGVGALIVVLAVMNGFRHELVGRILGFSGHVTVVAASGGLAGYDALAARIAGVDGVTAVVPVVEGQALAAAPSGRNAGVLVRGVAPESLAGRALIAENLVAGGLDRFGADEGVVIGSRLAARLGLRIGDAITLISPKGRATALGTLPRLVAYPILAVFEVGMYEYDNGVILMPLATAQAYFRFPGAVTAIEVAITTPETPEPARRAIAAAVAGAARVVTWQQTNAQFFGALQVERNVMFVILTLIIVVAAFNIVSSMIMLVKDKGRDIAILRTIGATRGAILRVFLLTGSTIGVVGTALGFVLGVAFALNIEELRQVLQRLTGTELFAAEIYFLSRLPARVDWHEVAVVVAMALALSFLATLYPAWRAARLDPAEALRYE